MSDNPPDLDQADEDIWTDDEISDEALEAAASSTALVAAASAPFTYVSGICC